MEALGIEPKLLIAQVVNFFIIVVVLQALLYKPILTILNKRKKEIEDGLNYTENMRKENEKAEEKKAQMIKEARQEGQRIIEEAQKDAKIEAKKILEETKKSVEAMLEKGRTTLTEEREAMLNGVRKEAVKLSVRMAKQLLSETISTEVQHKIFAKHMKEIENV
jgi:F-type H+-transporting ATPase subunit b